MLSGLVDKWKSQRQAKELLKNPVVSTAREAALHYWVNNKATSGEFSQAFVQGQVEGMMQRAIEVAFSPDPVAKCRELLVGTMYETSVYEHIVLSNPKTDDVNGWKTLPGVSGALWPHLRAIARENEIVRTQLQGVGEPVETENDIHDIGLMRYRICSAHMNVLSAMRQPLKDRHVNHEYDWFKPYYSSMLIWQEACLRNDIGLEQLIDPLEAIQYNAMTEMVEAGVQYPNLEWEHRFGRPLPKPRVKHLP